MTSSFLWRMHWITVLIRHRSLMSGCKCRVREILIGQKLIRHCVRAAVWRSLRNWLTVGFSKDMTISVAYASRTVCKWRWESISVLQISIHSPNLRESVCCSEAPLCLSTWMMGLIITDQHIWLLARVLRGCHFTVILILTLFILNFNKI